MSTPGTGPHASPEELDRLAAEPPGAPDPTGTAGHVAACAACREAVAGIRSVRERLRAAGALTPDVPPDVQRRVAAVLAAESARRSGGPVGVPTGSPRGRPARTPRWLAAAAALVVLGGAAVTAGQLIDPAGEPGAGTQAEGQQSPGGDAVADGAPEADGQPPPGGTEALGGAGNPVSPTATGTDYAPRTLAGQVGTLLTEDTSEDRSGDRTGGGAGTPAPARPADLAACLAALGSPGTQPLAVDLARWRGDAAVVVVAPLDGPGDAVRVLVLGPGCRAGDADLRYTASVVPERP